MKTAVTLLVVTLLSGCSTLRQMGFDDSGHNAPPSELGAEFGRIYRARERSKVRVATAPQIEAPKPAEPKLTIR